MTSKTSSDGTVQNYTYDANSNILTYSEVQDNVTKNSVTYQYDNINRLTSLVDSDNIRGYQYDANNNLTIVTDASDDDNSVLITYNKANLPTAYQTRHSSGNRTYGMSYYLNGNKYQETNTLDSVIKTYTYNTAGQLSSENETKNNEAVYSASYTYTPYGNRAQMSYTSGGTTEVTDYTYDANNRLTNEATSVNNDIKSAIRYYYDDNGNTTAEQRSTYTTTGTQKSNMSLSGHSGGSTLKLYRYDEFNRLIQYNDDGAEAKYTYGVDNLRATKTVNGATTSYVWNGQNLASETKNNTTTVYYYDPLGVNGAKTDNETFTRYIKDPHGNVVATSKNSTLYGTYDYTAFGNQLEATDTTNPFRYCGEYYDEESGLTYLRNRYYNPTTGRFMTEDPIKDGVNWYVYCSDNPINLYDPKGTAPGDSKRDTQDLYKVAEEVTNIVANQVYWPSSSKAMRKQRNVWANEARALLKEYVKKEFKGEGLAKLINEVIDDGTTRSVEENSSLLCVVAYYMDEMTQKAAFGLQMNVSYKKLHSVYEKAVSEHALFFIDDEHYITNDTNAMIKKYLGTNNPPPRPGNSFEFEGKVARVAFDYPHDTEEYDYYKWY